MTYFSYITKECEREAKNHGVIENVRKIAKQIEVHQSVDWFIPVGIFHQKPLGKSYRLFIAQKDNKQDHLMILFTVLAKSSVECINIQYNHENHDSLLRHLLDKENIESILDEKRASPEIPKIPDLNEKEREYLYTNYENPESSLILESDEWVKRIDKKKGKFSIRIGELFPIVYDASTNSSEETELYNDSGLGIIFRRYSSNKSLYLIAPVLKSESGDIQKIRSTFKKELEDSITQEGILKKSKRAYPDIILDKENLWIHSIEVADENANLALSEEEARILKDQEKRYPLFINGRPGSGKSTILQYLFADHVFSLFSNDFNLGFPLYLTYNDDLLDIARKNVHSIMTSNANKATQQRMFSDDEAEVYLKNCFVNFRDFLFDLLPVKERFSRAKRIGFSEYKERHKEHFGMVPTEKIRRISPELAWHIIRTYIKGTLVEEGQYLDPEFFTELPEKQKSVTQETFDVVFNNIWSPWYKDLCEKGGYWDDQDIARSLLTNSENNEHLSKHPVIFCDEAQDFTKNELRLIFRLSLFSNRNYYSEEDLNRIPFAFAGDPFQTINPTGFDWESTQTSFYQTIIAQLDKNQKPKLAMNYKELSFNYRSTANIVQLCNFIHLIRGNVFFKKNLIPQTTYFDREANMPGYFDIKSPVLRTQIVEQEETVIIVPCQEGEELEYVRRDEFLSTFALNDDKTQITRNVLSAMRAKGQGFKRVVIYNFGDACIKEYPKLITLMNPQEELQEVPHEEAIPLEYFINRLYVAASRAMNRLIIADTTEGLSTFWKFFRDFPLVDFVDRYKKLSKVSANHEEFVWTIDNIVKIQEGDKRNWDEEGRDDPASLGEGFFSKSGKTDAYLLLLAVKNFKIAGNLQKVTESEAYLFKANGEYEKSGDQFEKLGEHDKAIRMYWKAEAYQSIIKLYGNTPENEAANFMVFPEKFDNNQSMDLITKLVEEARENRIQPEEIWAKVFQKILSHIITKSKEASLKINEWLRIYTLSLEAMKFGLLSNTETKIINELKLRSTVYPSQLNVLHEIGAEPKLIIEYFNKHKEVPITEIQQDIVLASMRRIKNHDQILSFITAYPSIKRYSDQLLIFIKEKQQSSIIDSLTLNLITFLVDQKLWEIVLDFINKKVLRFDNSTSQDFSDFDWKRVLDLQFIKVLSVSKSLLKAPVNTKNDVSKYLFSKLIEDASGFYNDLTVKQAGIALERANMLKHCLEFYENVFDKKIWPADVDEIVFAKTRWLVCKTRQLDITKDENTRKRFSNDIRQKQKLWEINLIPSTQEFPEVDVTEKPKPRPVKLRRPTPALPDVKPILNLDKMPSIPALGDTLLSLPKTSVRSGVPGNIATKEDHFEVSVKCDKWNYLCSVHRGHKMTIRIDSAQEMVTILTKKIKLSGSDDEFQGEIEEGQSREGNLKYYVAPWDLTCIIRKVEEAVFVDLFQGNQDKELITIRIA